MEENKEIENEETSDSTQQEQNVQNEPKQEIQSNEKIETTVEEFDELNDRYKRILAEFENFKKRSLKEREILYNSLLGDIILEILPIVDNLENAVKAECKDEAYKQGVELVQKHFKDFLAKHNIQEIPSVGEKFDPGLHEAVSSIQAEGKNPGEIVQEFRKGYKIGSKVIRHSMVVVAS